MMLAATAAEARTAIQANKLAVILGVEMDSLGPDQVLALADEYGVRVVTPIHLADGPFGGAAVYSDAFNSLNRYLNNYCFGQLSRIIADDHLKFHLGKPQVLKNKALGAVEPVPISDGEFAGLPLRGGFPQGPPKSLSIAGISSG